MTHEQREDCKQGGWCTACGKRRPAPLGVTCHHCLALGRASYWRHHDKVLAAMDLYRQKHDQALRHFPAGFTGPRLACCGTWHPIHAVPFVCPICTTTYFEEMADAPADAQTAATT